MGNLKTAKDTVLTDLIGITDAAYPGDPAGTNANKAYFETNVHNYIKDGAIALQPARKYQVHPDFSSLGNPFFANVATAFAQAKADGSSSSDKAEIDIKGKNSSYTDALTLDATGGYIVFKGGGLYNNVIAGIITITAGSYAFKNCKITANIVQSGGVAEFLNCIQKGANTAQQGSSTLMIADCPHWGYIALSGNSNNFFLQGVRYMEKNGSNYSLVLSNSMTGGVYEIADVDMGGDIDDSGSLITRRKNVDINVTTRPTL